MENYESPDDPADPIVCTTFQVVIYDNVDCDDSTAMRCITTLNAAGTAAILVYRVDQLGDKYVACVKTVTGTVNGTYSGDICGVVGPPPF